MVSDLKEESANEGMLIIAIIVEDCGRWIEVSVMSFSALQNPKYPFSTIRRPPSVDHAEMVTIQGERDRQMDFDS